MPSGRGVVGCFGKLLLDRLAALLQRGQLPFECAQPLRDRFLNTADPLIVDAEARGHVAGEPFLEGDLLTGELLPEARLLLGNRLFEALPCGLDLLLQCLLLGLDPRGDLALVLEGTFGGIKQLMAELLAPLLL